MALFEVDEPFFIIGEIDHGLKFTFIAVNIRFPLLVAILILNLCLYKHLHARHRILTIGTKFVLCMCFGCLTMVITSIIEIFRQKQCSPPEQISTLTILAKLPQDITMSIAQLFSFLASFEFVFFIAPRSAQVLSLSLYFCSVGVASYVCDAYTSALSDHSIPLDFRVSSHHHHHLRFV